MDSETDTWRWVVLAAAFFNLLLNASTSYHVGVLNIALLDEYHSDVFMTSWLVSLYSSLFALAAPLGSIIINISNCRTCVFLSGILSLVGFVSSSFVTRPEWLFLTITLAGIGQSLSFVGGTVILAFYFPTLISIASGICFSGSGLGSFVHPVLLQALVDEYSLKGAFLILGGISFHSCIGALIFRNTKIETQRHKKNKQDSLKSKVSCSCFNHLHVLRYPAFICLTLSVFTYSIGFMSTAVYLPEYLVNVKGMNIVTFFFCVIATTLMSYHAGIYIFSLSFGIYASGIQCLFNPLTFRVLGFDKAPSGYGIILLAFGCAGLIGPPFNALLIEKFGFEAFFQFNGAVFLLASVLGVVLSLKPIPSTTATAETEADLKFLPKRSLHSSFCSIEFILHATNGNTVKDNSTLLDKTEKDNSDHKKTCHLSSEEDSQCASVPLCLNTGN